MHGSGWVLCSRCESLHLGLLSLCVNHQDEHERRIWRDASCRQFWNYLWQKILRIYYNAFCSDSPLCITQAGFVNFIAAQGYAATAAGKRCVSRAFGGFFQVRSQNLHKREVHYQIDRIVSISAFCLSSLCPVLLYTSSCLSIRRAMTFDRASGSNRSRASGSIRRSLSGGPGQICIGESPIHHIYMR